MHAGCIPFIPRQRAYVRETFRTESALNSERDHPVRPTKDDPIEISTAPCPKTPVRPPIMLRRCLHNRVGIINKTSRAVDLFVDGHYTGSCKETYDLKILLRENVFYKTHKTSRNSLKLVRRLIDIEQSRYWTAFSVLNSARRTDNVELSIFYNRDVETRRWFSGYLKEFHPASERFINC